MSTSTFTYQTCVSSAPTTLTFANPMICDNHFNPIRPSCTVSYNPTVVTLNQCMSYGGYSFKFSSPSTNNFAYTMYRDTNCQLPPLVVSTMSTTGAFCNTVQDDISMTILANQTIILSDQSVSYTPTNPSGSALAGPSGAAPTSGSSGSSVASNPSNPSPTSAPAKSLAIQERAFGLGQLMVLVFCLFLVLNVSY